MLMLSPDELNPEELFIVFDGLPGPDSCQFVEVENVNRQSLKTVEGWGVRDDGYAFLGPFVESAHVEKLQEALRKANDQIERLKLEMVERGKRTGLIHDAYEIKNDELRKANEALAEARALASLVYPPRDGVISVEALTARQFLARYPAPTADLSKSNAS
jgi:hypothetical protein